MKLNKKTIIIISSIVVVLLIAATIYGIWQAQGGRLTLPGSVGQSKEDVPQYSSDKRQELIDEVNKKYGTGDFNGAIELLEGQQDVESVETQMLLAGAYANAKDYKKSLEIYKQLDEAGDLPEGSFANIASIAERDKQYQFAIDMYKKAREYDSSGEQSQDQGQVDYYNYKIADLEKKL